MTFEYRTVGDERDALLVRGELQVLGRLVDASNATLLAEVTLDDTTRRCIYKPSAGERPLWDFPNRDLAEREVATAVLDSALGWGLIPRTALRDSGPYGPGMVQEWIEAQESDELVDVVAPGSTPAGWREVLEARDGEGNPVILVHADDPALQRLAVLDAIANNGDRKGGHVMLDETGALYGIDHGVTWHVEAKLRTVLWGWAAASLPADVVDDLTALLATWDTSLAPRLAALLSPQEIAAAHERTTALLASGQFPTPSLEWPAIPWPVF